MSFLFNDSPAKSSSIIVGAPSSRIGVGDDFESPRKRHRQIQSGKLKMTHISENVLSTVPRALTETLPTNSSTRAQTAVATAISQKPRTVVKPVSTEDFYSPAPPAPATTYAKRREAKKIQLARKFEEVVQAEPDSTSTTETAESDGGRDNPVEIVDSDEEQEQRLPDAIVLQYPPPPDKKDVVTITEADMERLEPEQFLNDTLIWFYLKYIQRELIRPEEVDKFHFFNTFFYHKYDQGYDAVKKWTKNVNIFEKEFIIIPINDNFHWSLVIIRNLPQLLPTAAPIPRDGSVSHDKPAFFFLDSMGGRGEKYVTKLRRYLRDEFRERILPQHPEWEHQVAFSERRIPFIKAKVITQNNSCDCGVFVLHYVELYCRESVRPYMIKQFQLGSWKFAPSLIAKKRRDIAKLIRTLARKQQEQ